MCGIAGLWGLDPARAELARVKAMLAAMRHRGPDGEGELTFPGGAAGMVRLALVDLSPRGQQPLWSPDGGVAIVFNGEHYTFREERARLQGKGHRFTTTTDTEVVLAAYLDRGLEFVHTLRGMYALALFDFRERGPQEPPTLIVARGSLGIKPLFLARVGDGVVFASELKGLLASGLVERDLDADALVSYLAHGFVLPPRTILRDVELLPQGTCRVYAPGQPVRTHVYYRTPAPTPRDESLAVAAGRLRGVLEESIRLHSLADAPVGAFLSGGVDSTGIVGLMRRHVPDLRTFTLRFPDMPGAQEASLAEAQALRFECRHTTVDVEASSIPGLLPSFALALDQPSTDGLNSWLIARAAGREVKAALSGLGGDEFFAGYPVARRMVRADTPIGRFIGGAGRAAHFVGSSSRVARKLAARRSPLGLWLQAHGVFEPREIELLTGSTYDPDANVRDQLDEDEPGWSRESSLGLALRLDARYYMGGQLLRDSDATSMAASLELRVPLCDVEVLRCARTIADDHKLAPGGGTSSEYAQSGAKRVLVEALRDVLPPDILQRPKRGFALPLDAWLGGSARAVVEDCLAPETIRARGLVDPAAVAEIFREPSAPYPRIWSLVVLELWARAVLDAPGPAGIAA